MAANNIPAVLELVALADDRYDAPHPQTDPEGRNVVFSGLALRPHSSVATINDAHRTLSTGMIAHTVHYQERFDIGNWLFVQQQATYMGRGRAHGEGRVYDRSGMLVSTFAQDSMVRHADRALDPRRSL
jgi:hypothetical protein